MSWSPNFIARLRNGDQRVLILEDIRPTQTEIGWFSNLRGIKLSTHYIDGYDQVIAGASTMGGTVTPGSWESRFGSWSVTLAGNAPPKRTAFRRGRWFRLRCGFAGQRAAKFETIAIGQVDTMQRSSGVWSIKFRDPITSLRQRITTDRDKWQLFQAIDTGAVLTAWIPGPGATSLVTTGFTAPEKPTSEDGALWIEPISGSPFWLRWSAYASGSGTFTVSSGGAFGTSTTTAGIGSAVTAAAVSTGHPVDILLRLLRSSGDGLSTFDDLPETWGLDLRDGIVDEVDAVKWRNAHRATVTPEGYAMLALEAQDNPAAYITNLFKGAGWWLTMRQGMITARCADHAARATPVLGVATLLDSQLIADGIQYWQQDPQQAVEYQHLSVTGDSTSVATAPGDREIYTMPARGELAIDLSGLVFNSHLSELETLREVGQRLEPWSINGPSERLSLPCVDMSLSRLCSGDAIEITSSHLSGSGVGDREGYARRNGVILGVSTDWMRGRVTLDVAPERVPADW